MLYLDNELSWYLILCLFYSGSTEVQSFRGRVRTTAFNPIGFQAVDGTVKTVPGAGAALVILVSADNRLTLWQDEKTLRRWYVYEDKPVELVDFYLAVDRDKLAGVSTALKAENTTSKNKKFLDAYKNIYLRCYANISGFDVDIKAVLCANIDPSVSEVSDFCGKTPGGILCSCNGGSRCDFNSACRYSGAFLEYTKADLPDWQSSPTCPGIATNAAMTRNSTTNNIAMNINVKGGPVGKAVVGVAQQHDAVLYNHTTSILFSAFLLFFVFLLFYFIKKSRQ